MTKVEKVIRLLDKIKKENPCQMIIVDLPSGECGEFSLSDCLIYEDPRGCLVFDAE